MAKDTKNAEIRAKNLAGEIFDALNSGSEKVKARAEAAMKKLKKGSDEGKRWPKAVLEYISAMAKEEKGDRLMGWNEW